eukprot:SAG25_NODE_232_length_11380_cov_15.425583_13_plen_22_part_01
MFFLSHITRCTDKKVLANSFTA